MALKILMADDEKDVLEIMAKKVAASGYDVVQANNGDEAWKKIQETNPDIIILDINMPGIDGFEVLKEVRGSKMAEKKWQPVIILSARRELQDIKEGYDLEADHYLPKPCDINDVLKAIRLMASLIPQNQPDQKKG